MPLIQGERGLILITIMNRNEYNYKSIKSIKINNTESN